MSKYIIVSSALFCSGTAKPQYALFVFYSKLFFVPFLFLCSKAGMDSELLCHPHLYCSLDGEETLRSGMLEGWAMRYHAMGDMTDVKMLQCHKEVADLIRNFCVSDL